MAIFCVIFQPNAQYIEKKLKMVKNFRFRDIFVYIKMLT